jgi:myo-inositol 2-dehydrogenase/D-chiro-inositol 1-dehydrogenase
MKALIIGSGRMARIRLAELHAAGVEAVIASRDTRHAEQLADHAGVSVTALERVDESRPDLIFVCSATARHSADVTVALKLGVPVLCEKPLASGSTDAHLLADMAVARDVPLYVAFQRRFDSAFRSLRDKVARGELGVLYHLRGTHFDRQPSRRDFIAESGGHFKDMLVHDIETILWLTGTPVTGCSAYGSVRRWDDYRDFDDCDVATIVLTLADGLTAVVQSTRHHPYGQDVRFEAVGSEGAFSVGLSQHTPINACEPDAGPFNVDPVQSFDQRFAEAFATETREFVEYINGTRESFSGCTAHDAVGILRVAEACEESWRASVPLRLEDRMWT